jgi:hypothetical protein
MRVVYVINRWVNQFQLALFYQQGGTQLGADGWCIPFFFFSNFTIRGLKEKARSLINISFYVVSAYGGIRRLEHNEFIRIDASSFVECNA